MGFRPRDWSDWIRFDILCRLVVFMCPKIRYGPGSGKTRFGDTSHQKTIQSMFEFKTRDEFMHEIATRTLWKDFRPPETRQTQTQTTEPNLSESCCCFGMGFGAIVHKQKKLPEFVGLVGKNLIDLARKSCP